LLIFKLIRTGADREYVAHFCCYKKDTNTFANIQKAHKFAHIWKDPHRCFYTEGQTQLLIYGGDTVADIDDTHLLIYRGTHTVFGKMKDTNIC